jgi:MFS family permease
VISAWAHNTFKALRYREYRVLWIGTCFSFLAFMMSSVVQSVVAFDLTGKNGAVGFVSLGMGIATILVSPFGGVVADRFSKRRMLFFGQTIIGLNFALVGVLILTGHITILALAGSTLVLGTVFSFIGPARQAWVGELVPQEDLPNGIALQQVGMTATRIFGPFIAGGLIALSFVGTGGTYLFMGGLFAIVVFTLTLLPPSRPVSRGNRSFMADMGMGLSHMRERPRLMLLALSFIGVIMGGFSYFVILPGLLENELGRPTEDMAFLLGISAISGFAVTIFLAGLAGSKHAWTLMMGGGVLLGAAIWLLAAAPSFATALGAMFLVGMGSSAFQLINNALVMKEADPAYHGRVMSVTMLAWGMNSLVAYPFGMLADRIGERETLMVMGSVVVAVTLVTWLFALSLGRKEAREPVRVATVAGAE